MTNTCRTPHIQEHTIRYVHGKCEDGESRFLHSAHLRELIALFLRLGFTAFGGPAAHIALFENEVVRRRRWLTHERFLDLLGVTNLIPGPNSTEMVIHIGLLRAGLPGMIVAGLSFILPAACITGVFAWLYVRYGSVPQAEGLLYGVKPVVVAIIAQALWNFAPKSVKSRTLAVVAAISALAVWLGTGELTVLVLAGAVMAAAQSIQDGPRRHVRGLMALAAIILMVCGVVLLAPMGTGGTVRPFSLGALFLFFFKVGSILYGTGYVLIAFIESSLVEHWHWITHAQLLDAVAVGQVTPGPLFSTSTFIGFILAGVSGATVATLGIFLPSFVFVAVSGPIIPKMRQSAMAGAFLDGVIAASLALMAVVTLQLGVSTFVDLPSVVIGVAGAILLFRYNLNSTWLILGSGLAGLLLHTAFK